MNMGFEINYVDEGIDIEIDSREDVLLFVSKFIMDSLSV